MEWLAQPYFVIWQVIFLKSVALIYFFAFRGLHKEILGLAGSQGVYPINLMLKALDENENWQKYFKYPSLFWLNSSDKAIKAVTFLGQILALPILFDVYQPFFFFLLWLLYLSINTASPISMFFQFDALLLEVGFLAIFFSILYPPPPLLVYVAWFYLFRLMFSPGIYKVLFGRKEWRTLEAMYYHFEIQPKPLWLAYWLHKLPKIWLKAATAFTIVVEIVVPFFIFVSVWGRAIVAGLTMLFHFTIYLAGDLAFFNLLSMVLCLPLLMEINPGWIYKGWWMEPSTNFHPWLSPFLSVIAIFLFFKQIVALYEVFFEAKHKSFLHQFRIASFYGMAAHFRTERYEIIIEGSDDLQTWLPYVFKHKIQEVKKPLPWLSSLTHSRFDTLITLASLYSYFHGGWLTNLLTRLLQGSPEVIRLLKENPFPQKPPKYIRCREERYQFSSSKIKSANGDVWEVEPGNHFCTTFYLADKTVPKKYKKHEPRPLVPFTHLLKPSDSCQI